MGRYAAEDSAAEPKDVVTELGNTDLDALRRALQRRRDELMTRSAR
jgi:hypothetical protein